MVIGLFPIETLRMDVLKLRYYCLKFKCLLIHLKKCHVLVRAITCEIGYIIIQEEIKCDVKPDSPSLDSTDIFLFGKP